MIRLALIGKHIIHSESARIYQELLGQKVDYHLLDIPNAQKLPKLQQLFTLYQGVSVTSPYKASYIEDENLLVTDEVRALGAINCISMVQGRCYGTNTDYLGVRDFFLVEQKSTDFEIHLLGSGVMAGIIKKVAQELNMKVIQYTRGSHGDLTRADLSAALENQNVRKLVVNACSRDFEYRGKLQKSAWFWDLNYALKCHSDNLPKQCDKYIDGLSLLKFQAEHALKFWKLK